MESFVLFIFGINKMSELTPKLNTGLIIEKNPSDFLGGSIPFEYRNLTKDWRPFRSRPERQRYAKVDALNCVSQASTNLWEAQANWMLENKLWPEDALNFWNKNSYIVDGKFEISERAVAKLSNTTLQGNTYQRVIDSIINDGVIPEIKWPATLNTDIDLFSWDKYYEEISAELKLLGKESTKYFTMPYESLAFSNYNAEKVIKKELAHAPIGMAVATCQPWALKVYVCDSEPNHAVVNDYFDKSYYIWDSYPPYEKFLMPGYRIYYALKAVLYPVQRIIAKPINSDLLLEDISYGEWGEKVLKLKKALNKVGWITQSGDIYDSNLANLIFNFQLANLSRTWKEMIATLKGRKCGPQTRQVLNELLNKKLT